MLKLFDYISSAAIPLFVLFVIIAAAAGNKKTNAYNSFIEGAREGPKIVLKIFPYLLAIFVAIKTFQVSGAFDFVKNILAVSVGKIISVPPEALAVALIKPLSGAASLAIFTDVVKTSGPDSMASGMSAVIMGSAETTFYVLAVYLGAAGIKKTKYLIPVCVIADGIGIIIAIVVSKIFF